MLTELCQEVRNWFDRDQPKFYGSFVIQGQTILFDGVDMGTLLKQGQYLRIIGSTFNDGVWRFPSDSLMDEQFVGSIWALAIPMDFIALSEKIDAWIEKYGGIDSQAMSPYNSESFGGYSYSKSTGGTYQGGNDGAGTWQNTFAKELNRYRKLLL